MRKERFYHHNTKTFRSLSTYDVSTFIESLIAADWSDILNCTDIDLALSLFYQLFFRILDLYAPVRTVRLRQNTPPWFNYDIHCRIEERDAAFAAFKLNPSPESEANYKFLRNCVQSLVKEAKAAHVHSKIESSKDDPKALWKTLKSLGLEKKASKPKISLKQGDSIITSYKEVADIFAEVFSSMADDLVKKLPPADQAGQNKHKLYYSEFSNNKFKIESLEIEYIRILLSNLDTKKATGLDNLNAKFLKDSASVIAEAITHIFNLCISKSKFPSNFKTAKVTPLYKKKNKLDPINYRPISILPILSKLLEKAILEQILAYLSHCNILYDNQSGFRACFSTQTALISITDSIRAEMDKGKLSGLLLLDPQKALDTVNHSLLLSKLSSISLDISAVSLIQNY